MKQIDSRIQKMLSKITIINDTNNPDFMRYNCFSLYLYMVCFSLMIALITTILQKQYLFIPVIAFLVVVSVIFVHILRKKKPSKKVFNALVGSIELLLTFVCPIMYITSGGMYSSTSLWLIIILVFSITILDGISLLIAFFLQLLLYCLCVYLDLKGIIPVYGELSGEEWYYSRIAVLIIVSVCVCGLVIFQIHQYKGQYKRLMAEKKESDHQRKHAEKMMAQFEEQKIIAENALKTQEIFLANMSHEIRTPMNTVVGLSDVIKTSEDMDEIHALNENIANASKVLLNIINDILDYSSVNSGKLAIINETYETDILFSAFQNMSKAQLEKKGLECEVIRENVPDLLTGDILRIQQVVYNLVNNAIKYTNSGKITYKVIYENNKLNIAVSDTGIGIKEEDLDTIFNSFSRADLIKNRSIEGTGLGLALTKRIVELMNGEIKVESKYGEGSTFTVIIPQEESDKKKVKTSVESNLSAMDLSKVKALYVDDTRTNHLVLEKIMQPTGWNLVNADSGEQVLAMDIEQLESFDIFLLDYFMPDMDGGELLVHLRQLGMKAPVVCVSADVTSESVSKFASIGFSSFIAKPINKNELIRVINELIIQ